MGLDWKEKAPGLPAQALEARGGLTVQSLQPPIVADVVALLSPTLSHDISCGGSLGASQACLSDRVRPALVTRL